MEIVYAAMVFGLFGTSYIVSYHERTRLMRERFEYRKALDKRIEKALDEALKALAKGFEAGQLDTIRDSLLTRQ